MKEFVSGQLSLCRLSLEWAWSWRPRISRSLWGRANQMEAEEWGGAEVTVHTIWWKTAPGMGKKKPTWILDLQILHHVYIISCCVTLTVSKAENWSLKKSILVRFLEDMNVTLLGKKVFAGVIKLKILRWGTHCGLSEGVLNATISILQERGRVSFESYRRGEGDMT